jgi:hypothetical protein
MKMPIGFLSLAAIGALIAAFILGFNDGKKKMDDFCGLVIRGTSSSAHADSLATHMNAIHALEEGDLVQAERLLHMLARVDATLINNCESDPDCRRLDTRSPDQALVQEALHWK